jgi:hypothetical protein
VRSYSQMARDAAYDRRTKLERMALDLALDAAGVAQFGSEAPLQVAELLIAACELDRETHALTAELGREDTVIRFALLVRDGVGRACADLGSPAADTPPATTGA